MQKYMLSLINQVGTCPSCLHVAIYIIIIIISFNISLYFLISFFLLYYLLMLEYLTNDLCIRSILFFVRQISFLQSFLQSMAAIVDVILIRSTK